MATKLLSSRLPIHRLKSNILICTRCCSQVQHDSLSSNINEENSEDTVLTRLNRTLTPWSHIPYDIQLELKNKQARRHLQTLANIVLHQKVKNLDFEAQVQANGGLACIPEEIKPSPEVLGYRSKQQYVVDSDINGQPCVGFYIKPGKIPNMLAANSVLLKAQKLVHYELAMAFQEFVTGLPYPCLGCKPEEGGHWKCLLVRNNKQGHLMVAVTFNPCKETETQAMEEVRKFFVNGPGKLFDIHSVHFQASRFSRCHDGVYHNHNIHGNAYITEELLGYKFQISPYSFFQINVPAAEILYETIREVAKLTPSTTLLDICCGTGTIGILMSSYVNKVIGLEVMSQSVDDARMNAKRNNVHNAEFVCTRAEWYTSHLRSMDHRDLVVVANPSRGGFGMNVIRALRKCTAIRRLVYVSCAPTGRARFNFARLLQAPQGKVVGEPFTLTRAVPIDMFPHTTHYELVLLFERCRARPNARTIV